MKRYQMEHRLKEDWRCTAACGKHFDEPLPPLNDRPVEHALKWLLDEQRRREPGDTMPINTGFNWLSPADLEDPTRPLPN